MDGDNEMKIATSDICKISRFQWQRQKDEALAKPKTVFSYSTLWPQQKRRTSAELKSKCSPHTELLAMPRWQKPKIHYVSKAEKEAQRELMEEMTKEELKWFLKKPLPSFVSNVKKSALTAKSTPRLDVIAMAKLKPLVANKRVFFDKLPKKQKEAMLKYIKENMEEFRTRYPMESDKMYEIVNGAIVHATCTELGGGDEKECKKHYICELNKNERKQFRKRMKALALPRVTYSPQTGPNRGPKKNLKDFEPWLSLISQPRSVYKRDRSSFDPFRVRSRAFHYVATERIQEMARPKRVPPPPPMYDFEGNELPPRREWSYNSRRRIVASPRTVELAVPRFVKKKAAEDTKDDPFAVLRRALTAFCTQRTRELAMPRMRK